MTKPPADGLYKRAVRVRNEKCFKSVDIDRGDDGEQERVHGYGFGNYFIVQFRKRRTR